MNLPRYCQADATLTPDIQNTVLQAGVLLGHLGIIAGTHWERERPAHDVENSHLQGHHVYEDYAQQAVVAAWTKVTMLFQNL